VASLTSEDRTALSRRIAHNLETLMVGQTVVATLHSNIATAVKPGG
jgi:hypothetical protein